MIKITCGVYGHYVTDPETGKSHVVARGKKSKPFELEPEQEARLVGLGVAEYVNTPEPDNEPETDPDEPEKPLEDMTAKELREIGKEYGLAFKVRMSKAEMVEAIKAEWPQEGGEDYEDDGEDAPSFDAAEAVE